MDDHIETFSLSPRLNYVDVMKGVGILLVVLGHCITQTAYPLNRWLLSFHMPLCHRIYRSLISGSLETHGRYPHFLILFIMVMIIELILLPLVIRLCPLFFGIHVHAQTK